MICHWSVPWYIYMYVYVPYDVTMQAKLSTSGQVRKSYTQI